MKNLSHFSKTDIRSWEREQNSKPSKGYAKESRQIVSEVFEIENDEDHDHSLCPTRHGWNYPVVFYGIIPSNPLASLPDKRGIMGNSF
jgi:hypothetical protein